ncbi:calcium-activated chloride channel regulator 1-like, partial [Limulus polyphemus]|uniref:Calcium-activated chloride channel regulator 1-like n=1 Tax=Limulus polyphemus TaxID=6850 RepID=A0ABM1TRE7_LIMPO
NLPSGYTPPEVSTPHFNVRRAKETDDYVILVDSSWNVQYTVGKEEVQRIINRIILEFLPDNATASLLVYSKELKSLVENIKLDEFSNRKNLVESLETELNSTNIEDGQALGKALFKITQMENREGVSVVLLTNGDEDMTPFVTSHSVKAAIVNSGIRINTLLFGSQHKNKIQDLASITGGKLFIVETKKWDFNMASLVSAAVLQALVSTSNQEEYTHQKRHSCLNLKTRGQQSSSSNNHRLWAEIGKWEIIPLSTFLQTQIILIRAYVTTKSDIFALEGWTITSKDDIPRISIFANLKDRSNVITGQKMNATVYCPGNKVQFVALRDDGLGADLSANDGVHSGHFTDFQGNGSYHVEVAVLVEDGDFVKSLLKERIQNIPEPQVITTPPKRYRNKHSLRIQRSCYAGSFYLKHNLHSSKGNSFPPSRVSDLQVTKVQQNQSTLNVTLQWTAPGGKLDTGQVAYYNFRRSFNMSTLRTNFHSADNLTKDHLVGGELEPKERGQKQSAVFQILVVPYDYQEMFISMKSLNDEKNESPTSNIVPVYFEVTPPETTTTEFIDITSTESTTSENTDASTTTTIVTTNEITEENVVGLNLPVILLVSVFGSLSLLSLILISIFVLRVRKRKLSEPIRHEPRFESPRETTP